jgi:hypothetical protein
MIPTPAACAAGKLLRLLLCLLFCCCCAVLQLEETVLEFMADSSKTSLEFPGSTSNYEVTTEHIILAATSHTHSRNAVNPFSSTAHCHIHHACFLSQQLGYAAV